MGTIEKKLLETEKASEELVLPLAQTDVDYPYTDEFNIAADEDVKQISKLFLTRNRVAYEMLNMECNKKSKT